METHVQLAAQLMNCGERRREVRERISTRVTISDLANLKEPFPGRMVDTSTSGVRLAVSKPVKAAASLAVEWDDTCVLGDVAYCIADNDTYLVGVKTNYVIFDRTRFHRSHNLDLRRKSG